MTATGSIRTCTNDCEPALRGSSTRSDRAPGEDGFEACDDGNHNPGDGCDRQCRREVCGNGRLDQGEACDDGNRVETGACQRLFKRCGDGSAGKTSSRVKRATRLAIISSAPIRPTCRTIASQRCGDGQVQSGVEACDDGNQTPNDGCENDCTLGPDGGAAGCSVSCKVLKAQFPQLGSGRYWLDPDGAGGDGPFQAYCDMVTDGGGWTYCYTTSRHVHLSSRGSQGRSVKTFTKPTAARSVFE